MSKVFLKKVISEFFGYSKKSIDKRESDLSKKALATLLKSLSVMSDFQEIFQKITAQELYSCQYKKRY